MSDNPVFLKSFSTNIDARIVAGLLETNDIPVEIRDEHLVSINWFYSNAIGGVKLYVRQSDFAKAKELLNESKQTEMGEASWGKCPACGATEVQYSADTKRTYLTWLYLGIPLLFPKKRLHCLACDHSWRMF